MCFQNQPGQNLNNVEQGGVVQQGLICSFVHRGGGATCSSVVRAFAHGAMGRRIDPSWWTIELFLVPASAPQLV